MEVGKIAVRIADNALEAADLITIANNPVHSVGFTTGSHVLQIEQEATGTALSLTIGAGDNEAVDNITPRFFPKAVAGQRVVAYVDDLDWANNNLVSYEYLTFQTTASGNAKRYLVSGISSVTTDESYDPFDGTTGKPGENIVGSFACYAGISGQMFD